VAKLICLSVFLLIACVVIGGLTTQTCMAGQPTPCKDTEHPNEPPCNMRSCKRQNGEAQCSHYCSKAKGCCFCKKDQCYTGTPNTPEDERPQ